MASARDQLEFKSRAVLESPGQIARGVVALLNAVGGEVWAGIAESNESATAYEPIQDVALKWALRGWDWG